jgi:hypothetical protein
MHSARPVSILLVAILWACTRSDGPLRLGQKLSIAEIGGVTSNRSRETAEPGKCSLSPAQQIEAVKRFEALMPVVQHPRCANCHGGIDFFSPGHEGAHGGGAVEMIARDVYGPDGKTIVARSRPNFETCGSCHDASTRRWEIPAPMLDVNFAGRTAGQICEQIKRFSHSVPELMSHIEKDELIRLGFEGRRGHTSLAPLPPPMTAEAFNASIAAWVESMKTDYDWPEPLSCGCVAPTMRYRVMVRSSTQTANYGEVHSIHFNAELQSDPADPAQLVGSGRYSGWATTRDANHCLAPNRPENKKVHPLNGKLVATGSVIEWPGKGSILVYGLGPTESESVEGVPPGIWASTSSPGLGIPLEGPVTTKHERAEGNLFQSECTGKIVATQEITITDLNSP